MKQRSTESGIWMGYDILTEKGPFARPQKIVFWEASQFKHHQPESPFHYSADALLGLSLVHLNKNLQHPFATPQMNYSFANESWKTLEPHHELYARSQPRIQALRDAMKLEPSQTAASFERSFTEVLQASMETWGMDLAHLCGLIESIEELEHAQDRPLLYNFELKFSRETLSKLHFVHSLLFNLRALLAMDYNAHVQDAAHEAVKVDSITDYLPKAEYVANDALLYWSFKRCREEMPKRVADKLEKSFFTYSHNGAALIEGLPKSFLKKLSTEELEETLFLVQMDWLLGTDAGLLFRIREELYGIVEGYEQIFYHDIIGQNRSQGGPLSVNCQITRETLDPHHSRAAS